MAELVRVQFEIAAIPTAKGRPRAFYNRGLQRIQVYSPEHTRQAEETITALATKHAPPMPIQGPIALRVQFVLPAPESWPRWKREVIAEVRHVGRPDLDNYVKLLMDSLNRTGRFWRDDSQVCELWATKRYGEVPRTLVVVQELEQPERQRRVAPAEQGKLGI